MIVKASSSMYLRLFFTLCTLYAACLASDQLDALTKSLFENLEKSDETSDERISKELNTLYKFVAKEDLESFKRDTIKEMSKEENDRLKYYEDVLKKLKDLRMSEY
ncbi:uncharacterized protein LOC128669551 isoform X2 [Plodia interpunctella]|uniref:uncharacterized protein LOC128669551 isoform X2 n=1 Tax=Plodia interpunctella TaxID=58824 RepID=UPI00236806A2|nr:uncharacterized protein LOC128669551 isoform X2 [Plodia interpunctella]